MENNLTPKEFDLSKDEMDKITKMVIELQDNESGISIEYQGNNLIIYKNKEFYKLSTEELVAMKIFLDTLSLSVDTLRSKIK